RDETRLAARFALGRTDHHAADGNRPKMMGLLQLTDQITTVPVGKSEVADHDVEMPVGGYLHRVRNRFNCLYLVAQIFEPYGQRVPCCEMIFHQQDSKGGDGGRHNVGKRSSRPPPASHL